MYASALDLETGAEMLRLERARVVKIRDGGFLVSGDQMFYRGTKSKGEAWKQTWWCVPITSAGWRDIRAKAETALTPAVKQAHAPPDKDASSESSCARSL